MRISRSPSIGHDPSPILAALALAAAVAPASGQTVAVQAQQSLGTSSESITAGATQVRLLGDLGRGLRVDVEGAWGGRSGEGSDVFGTAYPYGGQVQFIEAYAEVARPEARGVRAVKAGRYRTPFGIWSAGDHAYFGFLRPPLIRYGGYYALSSGYLEHGVAVTLGGPQPAVETSVGRPADVGTARGGAAASIRWCAASSPHGPVVVGASYLNTTPDMPERFARGRARFGGLDARWMHAGVLLRGEWLSGRPFDGTATPGGYADLVVHRPRLGPVTLAGPRRAARLRRAGPVRALHAPLFRGGRVRVWKGAAVSAGLIHQAGSARSGGRPRSISASPMRCACPWCSHEHRRAGRRRPWHRRLEARVAATVALLIVVVVAAVLAITTRLVLAQSRSRAAAELEAAAFAFHAQSRAPAPAAASRLVTELPVFRAHLTDRRLATDRATIDAMADGYRADLRRRSPS